MSFITNEQIMGALRFIRTSHEKVNVFVISHMAGAKLAEIDMLINALKDKGYIRQDSRDDSGAYDPFSYYYTVPAKRQEIDNLLEEDKRKSLLTFSEIDCLTADFDDRTLMCVKCLAVYKPGLTHCRNCLGGVYPIDTRMLDIIYHLNKKGYQTTNCCSGHSNGGFKIYLIISNVKFDEASIPKGYTINPRRNDTTLRSIPYHKAKGIKTKKAREAITMDELQTYNCENLENLRSWVVSLPSR